MYNIITMNVVQPRHYLSYYRVHFFLTPVLFYIHLSYMLIQGPPRQIFHDEVNFIVIFEGGIELDDVRVVAVLKNFDLLFEGVAAELTFVKLNFVI